MAKRSDFKRIRQALLSLSPNFSAAHAKVKRVSNSSTLSTCFSMIPFIKFCLTTKRRGKSTCYDLEKEVSLLHLTAKVQFFIFSNQVKISSS